MDNQDKIFDKFKDAAQNAEAKEFPAMEKVWSRVEEKLDKKEDKKTIALWKKIAVAASLLLVISLGYQFLNSDKTNETTPKVVIQETDKKEIQQPIVNQDNEIISSDSGIVSQKEAIQILEKHTKTKETVAIQETTSVNVQMIEIPTLPKISEEAVAAPVQADYYEENNSIAKDKSVNSYGYSSIAEKESANAGFAQRKAASAKKSAPLIVLNGNAIAHSNDQKKDKMMQAEMSNIVEPENVDSLVILDNPLYIVDGIYYSENDLFGANPTSPYAPLDKQEIKTITILQDLEATEKYGEKGKKGVVIITTKTGKPALKK